MSNRDPNTVNILKLAKLQDLIAKLPRKYSIPLTCERDELIIEAQILLIELKAIFCCIPMGITAERSDKAWSLLSILHHDLIAHYKEFLNFVPFCCSNVDEGLKENLGLIGVWVMKLEKETVNSIALNKILERTDVLTTPEIKNFVQFNYSSFISNYCNRKLVFGV